MHSTKLLVLVLGLVLGLSLVQSVFASIELAYDNGTLAAPYGVITAQVVAVHFSLPAGWSGARLSGVEIFQPLCRAAQVVKVHVSSGQGSGSDLFTSTVTLTVFSGWNTFALSGPVPASFYIAVERNGGPGCAGLDVVVGEATGGDASRSYFGPVAGPSWFPVGDPVMIRALIDPLVQYPVGGIMLPGVGFTVLVPWVVVLSMLGIVSAEVFILKRRANRTSEPHA